MARKTDAMDTATRGPKNPRDTVHTGAIALPPRGASP
jgi:hypothetical protein